MKRRNIEILYPELSNLYGDLANVRCLLEGCPDCDVRETHLGERPAFLREEVSLVYRGTMTESAQGIFVEEMGIYRSELLAAIERGQDFLVTGNALETFGREIRDSEGEVIPCLDIFPFHTERNLMKRYNSLYVGRYGEVDIVGYKSQFSHSFPEKAFAPLFETVRGDGLYPGMRGEGLRVHNFRATYLIGPLLVLNPRYAGTLAEEVGLVPFCPPHEETAMEAFRMRYAEYTDPATGFTY